VRAALAAGAALVAALTGTLAGASAEPGAAAAAGVGAGAGHGAQAAVVRHVGQRIGRRAGQPSAAPGRGPTLTVAVAQTVDSLSPFLAQRQISTEIHRLVYDFLTDYSAADSTPVPGLAASWRSSADKRVWTYTIRRGARWTDGRPVTAHDAAFTFRTMMTDPAAATANGSFVRDFASVSAPDDTTLVIRLKRPDASMLALDVPIVPEHVWRTVHDYADFNNDRVFPVVGDGPFVLARYRPGQDVLLTANPHYWRGAPHFGALLFRFYKDQDAAVEALRKGEVDFVGGLTPAQYASLRSAPGVTAHAAASKRFYALAANPGATAQDGRRFGDGNPALRDVRVRQALAWAVDRRMLAQKAAGGYAVPGAGYLPPRYAAYRWAPPAALAYRRDPARAAALLDAAGYRLGAGGLRRGPDGRVLTLRLLGRDTDPLDQRTGAYLAGWFQELGIRIQQRYVDPSELGSEEQRGDYDLALDGWTVDPDPDYVLSIQTCAARPAAPGGVGASDDYLCDPVFDRLYARQSAEYDPARRAALVRAAEQRLYQQAVIDVLYYPDILEAYRSDRISSIETQPLRGGNINGQDGYWSWWSAVPGPKALVSDAAATDGLPDVRGLAAVGAAAVLGAAAVAAAAVIRRRRADERE